ncbi:flavocytochrome c [Budviciaceae bacterium BWR-B9]|uniref:Flavocytochrome c n=1 Tax=Limnobaculum allomyrinae TaxID=2791986 RepID=A0ABS1ITV8_9GAMM|nr:MULTISPECIES: flavocytochrome c [Limnobaculum]MBK5145178.1 flavocytochrome c [Limnobaculum allomyrinae]MBV7693009.1 flavocytochrome c [Limnobaculum sp. M2-1]
MSNSKKTLPPDSINNPTRRSFLTKGALLATGGVMSLAMAPTQAAPVTINVPETVTGGRTRFHQIYDVIVVGSGFAGLAAALEAKSHGLSVLVIEKMAVFGGNSTINGGAFAVAGSPQQKEAGIQDSPELMYQDMLKAGRGLNHRDILHVLVNGTQEAYEFTLKHGVRYKPFVQHFGGHSVPRTLQTVESSGAGIIMPMRQSAQKLGVIFKSRCKFESFIQDNQQTVVGIEVKENYYFPDENSGLQKNYGARYGVIMCSGGFSNDLRFRMIQDPQLVSDLDTTNHQGATAEGILAMLKIGATPVQLDLIQLGPWSSPDEKGFGNVSQFNTIAGYPMGIMVDARTGKRFTNELADRKAREDAILAQRDEQGKPVYPICFTNKEGAKNAQSLPAALKYQVAWQFDTLKQLADHFALPYENLQKEVDEYNTAVANGSGDRLGKDVSRAISLAEGPYFAVRVWPKVHYTMGGVQINPNAQVLNSLTGNPIQGLYAAGEVTGGPHGASRLGSCAVADGLVLGRIAGAHVATQTANPLFSTSDSDNA